MSSRRFALSFSSNLMGEPTENTSLVNEQLEVGATAHHSNKKKGKRENESEWCYSGYRKEGSLSIFGEWRKGEEATRLIVFGPDWLCSLGTLALLVVPSVFAYRYLLSKDYMVIIYSMSISTSLIGFFIVLLSDPGLLLVYSNAKGAKWTYCDYCNSYRPEKAIHCSTCNTCIGGYDVSYFPLCVAFFFFYLLVGYYFPKY